MHANVRDIPVTARVTTRKGADAGRYYVDGPGNYYLDGDEPPGRWQGKGAAALGLDAFDDDDFLTVMDGTDPRSGSLLGSAHTDRTVRGFDITFSAPKSVSTLYALGDEAVQAHALAAHDAAVDMVIGWVEAHAHCRFRVGGEVQIHDADGIIAAVFRQHTSRALDPQLHTHAIVANRVMAPDGRWLALDARTLKHDQQTLSALYHAGLRAELTTRLGVRWKEPENGIAEMSDVPSVVLAEFSRRTDEIEDRLEIKIERFADNLGRRPTPRERWRLEREAVLDSRPAKPEAPGDHEFRADWHHRIADLGYRPDEIIAWTVDRARPEKAKDLADEMMAAALSALSENQPTWRPAELTRELAAAVATSVRVDAAGVAEWVEGLARRIEETHLVDLTRPAPPGTPVRRDGRPITESALDRILTTPAILEQEERLMALFQDRIDQGGTDRGQLADAEHLSAAQKEAASAVAGDRELVLVVGPAGTGKTTALRPAADQLRRDGRAVFGVAPSAAAAEVLGDDASIAADTIDKLLVEHRLDRPPDHRFDLPPKTTVILDEAAMVPTQRLAELVELAERRSWRLALIGDPMQFSAVGRGGMFAHLVDTHGAIELDRVHRFDHEWERQASLRLRQGDTSVVGLYEEHDRLHGGTSRQMRRAVVAAWWEATQAGEQAAMMAPTREAVGQLNLSAQLERLGAGELDRSRYVDLPELRFYVGDTVATRRNDRKLRTGQDHMVKNRDRWTIETIHPDKSLTVTGRSGRVRLPADYVGEHVELGYAETSHANQGRTVDRSFLYLDGPTDARGIYVSLTRGRQTNEAFVVLQDEETPADVITEAMIRTWCDQPAITHLPPVEPEADEKDTDRALVIGGPALRSKIERRHELNRMFDPAIGRRHTVDQVQEALAQQKEMVAKLLHAERRAAAHRAELDKYEGRAIASRLHRDEITASSQGLESALADMDQHEKALPRLQRHVDVAHQALKDVSVVSAEQKVLEREQGDIDRQLLVDQDNRGEAAITGSIDAAVEERLGPIPLDEAGRTLWKETAGQVEQYRAAFDVEDRELLGPKQSLMAIDSQAVAYRAANEALDSFDRAMDRQHGIRREAPGLSL